MHPELRTLSGETLGHTGTIVLGDGSSELVLVRSTVLTQICALAKISGQPTDSEVDGLLMGPKPQAGDLLIEEAVPLGTDYRHPQSLDLLLASAALLQPNAPRQADSKPILGVYRILSRGDDKLLNSDLDVLSKVDHTLPSLSDFHCCFMLVPLSPSEISLRILMCEHDEWREIQQITLQPDSEPDREPVREFVAEPTDSVPLPQTAGPQSETYQTRTAAPIVHRVENRNRKTGRHLTLAFALALFVLTAAGGVYRWVIQGRALAGGLSRAESPSASRTGFAANRDGSAWKLTWDSAVVEAMKPTGAILSIQDGAGQQEVALTMADLSSGTLYYTPTSGELAFRMQVLKDGTAVAEERVRVLEGIKPGTKPLDSAARLDFRTPRPQEPDRALSTTPPQTNLGQANSDFGAPSGVAIARNPPARNFVPPRATATSAESPVLTAAASVTTLAVPLPPTAGLEDTLVASLAPPPAAPSPEPTPPVAAPPEPQPARAVLATTPPSAVRPAQTDYIAPRPTKQVQPIFSAETVGVRPAQVEVHVAVNAIGKVTKVTPVGCIANFDLMVAITKAAQFWQFEPARLHGQPVPSEVNLIFHF